jgi:signal transduction histidine kinase
MARNSVKESIGVFRDLVTGQFAVSYTAFFITRFGIIFAIETERTLGHPISYAIFFTLVAETIRFLILVLADKTYMKHRASKPIDLRIVMITWFASSFIGALIPGLFLEKIAGGHLFIRVIPSTIFTFLGFALGTVIVSQVHNEQLHIRRIYKNSTIGLDSELEKLNTLFNNQREREEIAKTEIFKGLDTLRGKMHGISTETKDADIAQMVSDFEKYGVNVVRKFSHGLRVLPKSEQDFQELRARVVPTITYFSQLNNLNISAMLSTVILFLGGGASQIARNGYKGMLFTFALAIVITPLMIVLARLIEIYVSEARKDRILAVSTAMLVIYVIADITSRILVTSLHQPFPFPSQVTAFRTVFTILIVSSAATLHHRQQVILDRAVNFLEENESRIAKINYENERMNRELAQLLHGPVQGKLASIVMSLNLYLSESKLLAGASRTKWIAKAKSIMEDIVLDLQDSDNSLRQENDIQTYLESVTSQYAQLLNIRYRFYEDSKSCLDSNKPLTKSVLDIIANALTNSLRHGLARNIDIELEVFSPRGVKLVMRDDGVGPPDSITPGFGLNHIVGLNGRWSLERDENGGAKLTVIVETPDASY